MPALARIPRSTTFEPLSLRPSLRYGSATPCPPERTKVTLLLVAEGNPRRSDAHRPRKEGVLSSAALVHGAPHAAGVTDQLAPGYFCPGYALATMDASSWESVPLAILAEYEWDVLRVRFAFSHLSLLC
jgi:hypothetical protein